MASSKAGIDREGLIYNLDSHVIVPVVLAATNVTML
jgi:hypothetical protein